MSNLARDHFALFGLPAQFALDVAALAVTYRALQSQCHPDRFAHASTSEQLAASQLAAQINDGYHTLKAPVSRADYLLSLRGFDLAHETQTLQDNAFLIQQMTWREALSECDADAACQALRVEVSHSHQCLLAQLATQLAAEDNDAAAVSVRKLKFIEKLLVEIERVEDALFDA
ncbi:MAG: co-chaperone HscB [Aeromonas sp.]